jgi:NADH dehydrogenase [ubiquinone] 1 alpha subcomplex assembly factor 7
MSQEILDALPVHQFQMTKDGWRERLVDTAPALLGANGEPLLSDTSFRFVLSSGPTPAVATFLMEDGAEMGVGAQENGLGAQPGDEIEVCPRALSLVQEVAKRIAKDRGGALFIDYGAAHAFPNSLRGFYRHEETHVLNRPGEVDLTADVDFASLRRVLRRIPGVSSYGPVEQGRFLAAMGMPDRIAALLESPSVTDDQAEALVLSYERLVDPQQMGERYKVLAIIDEEQPLPPGGFEEGTAQLSNPTTK